MSEDPPEGWLPPQVKGGRHPAEADKYRPPSPAERRRAALDLWLDGGTIVAAALLAGLNLYV